MKTVLERPRFGAMRFGLLALASALAPAAAYGDQDAGQPKAQAEGTPAPPSPAVGQAPGQTAPNGPAEPKRSAATPASAVEPIPVKAKRIESYKAPIAETATKTDTPVMETPVSVQVVPQVVLRDQSATTLDKAVQNVSGVTPVTAGMLSSDDYIIRGFDNFAVSFEDGLRHDEYTFSGFPRDLANVERVEIIKGPASILYGQLEPGGLVNVITKKPLDDPFYMLEGRAGSFSSWRFALDATGPLIDSKKLLYRFNIAYENAKSFRDFIHLDRLFFYPTLEWRPTPSDRITVEVKCGTGSYISDNGLPFTADGKPADVPISRNYAEPGANNNPTTELGFKVLASHQFGNTWKLRAAYNGEYTSAPTPNAIFYNGPADAYGNLPRYYFGGETKFWHWGHEGVVDATARPEGLGLKHTILVGGSVYYMHGYYDYGSPCVNADGTPCTPADATPSINIYNPVYGQPFPPLDPNGYGFTDSSAWAFALYAQDQVEIPHHVHVLVGLRQDVAQVHNSGYGGGSLGTVRDTPPPVPRLGALWNPVGPLSLYASFTSNFGASALGTPTASGVPLPPENAQQYEAGVKTELLQHRLSATAAVYQIDKQNIPYTDPNNPQFSIAIGEARSRGVELDVRGELGAGLSAIAAYAYTSTLAVQDSNGFQGKRFPNVPLHSGSAWVTWAPPRGALKGLRLGAGMVARSSEVNFSLESIPGFATMSAMAAYGWTLRRMRMEAQVNVDNALDERYFASISSASATPGAPRNYLGTLRLRY